ncbi:YihY/virulence factor BrkB family protein [Rhizobium tumorigenes]|uniref:YihY/virulence factor BrkB family protein n=1 Tax=Rhizobium tumorigenes TaxID=2041385 RepID=A0AAF1KQF0_9HYPH|nr:YihY/virulence factor BrkB family protein [Rhizobium tumorigenes]WFR97845.1 YihY/virulence factor BrkB family protein [Rhizobium tumorigenes]
MAAHRSIPKHLGLTVLALVAVVVGAAFWGAADRPEEPLRKPDHGHLADVPEAIPAKGLRDVFWRVLHEVSEDRVTLIAGGVTFYLLLALFPALAALVSLYGLVADPVTISENLGKLAGMLPPGAFDMFADQIKSLAEKRDSSLGLTFFFGLAVALWSTHNGTLAIFDAMNIAYEEKEKRGIIKLNVVAFCFTICGMLAAIVMIGLVALLPTVLSYIWLDQFKENALLLLRWPIVLVVVAATVLAIYRVGPSREPPKLRWMTWGALLTIIGLTAMSLGLSYYLSHFANYNATYGTLGALIGFLVWTWLSVTVLIVGGELNAELEHQTAKDSTTGSPKPLGQRGAYVADNVASSGG